MIAEGNGGGLRPVPVSYRQVQFLRELEKCGTPAYLSGEWIPADHRKGEVLLNGRQYKTRTVEGLVYLGALYREVTWNPTKRVYDVSYRLTHGTDISFRSDCILVPLVGHS